jgi:hypothetical protein
MPRLSPLIVLTLAAARAWTCPPSNAVPASFRGSLQNASTSVTLTADAVFVRARADAVDAFRCVLSAFVPPTRSTQVYLTYGSRYNYGNDTDTGCAFLDVSTPSAPLFFESLDISPCPIGPAGAAAFAAAASAPPDACPARAVAVPAPLRGIGNQSLASGDADARLALDAEGMTTVTEGSLARVACVARVAQPHGAGGPVELAFSNAAGAPQSSCVWVERAGSRALAFKEGEGSACPLSFDGAAVFPFNFAP